MGSQLIQSKLWGRSPKDWANIQEQTSKAGYDFVLSTLSVNPSTKILDIGCGSGYFCRMANNKGANVTGLDATPESIEEATIRLPDSSFLVGEMEDLPFKKKLFDLVCGFNSFQYAENIKNALTEAKRVLKDDGKFVTMIWGSKEECEAATYLKAVGSLLPPLPPGAPGPFALSENQLLEKILEEVGFEIVINTMVITVWDYPDTYTALKGLLCAGPVTRAIENCGFEKVRETLSNALQPFIQDNGHVVYNNKFKVIIAIK